MAHISSGKRFDSAPWWIVVFDVLMINFAVTLAYVSRYRWKWFVDVSYDAPLSAYIPFNLMFSLIIPLVLWAGKDYVFWRGHGWMDHFYHVVNAVASTLVLTLALAFVIRPLVYSRLLLLESGFFMIALLSFNRASAMMFEGYLRRRGVGIKRIIIVGAGEVGRRVMRTVVARADLGYRIVGYVDDNPNKGEGEIGRFKGLGSIDKLPAVIDSEDVDEVIITLPWNYHRRILNVMRECARRQVSARLVPDLFQMSLSRVEVSDLGGLPLIEIREIAFTRLELAIKRAIDLVGITGCLLFGWPIFLLIAVLIKLDSPGPVLFTQERVGKNGEHFKIYKFRSMRMGADKEREKLLSSNEGEDALFKIRNDPRRTRFGSFLRRVSLDELPQLINVFKGDMSLVGPRPQILDEVALYLPWHKKRLAVPPGITGLWQVSGRSDLTFDEMVLLDLYYIENWSPWLDLNILLRTLPKIITRDGAY